MATHDSQTTDLLNNTDMRKLLGRMVVTELNGTFAMVRHCIKDALPELQGSEPVEVP